MTTFIYTQCVDNGIKCSEKCFSKHVDKRVTLSHFEKVLFYLLSYS